MKFHPPPNGKIIQGFDLPPGQHILAKDLPWDIRGIMLFFHKQSMGGVTARDVSDLTLARSCCASTGRAR
jgi:hypothetical protein